MAVISPTVTANQEDHKYTVTWSSVTESDTAAAFVFQEFPADISVEIDGTHGGATTTMVGSNGGGGVAVTEMDGSTAAWTADALFSVLQRPGQITPTFTGGSSQSLTIYMVIWYQND